MKTSLFAALLILATSFPASAGVGDLVRRVLNIGTQSVSRSVTIVKKTAAIPVKATQAVLPSKKGAAAGDPAAIQPQ